MSWHSRGLQTCPGTRGLQTFTLVLAWCVHICSALVLVYAHLSFFHLHLPWHCSVYVDLLWYCLAKHRSTLTLAWYTHIRPNTALLYTDLSRRCFRIHTSALPVIQYPHQRWHSWYTQVFPGTVLVNTVYLDTVLICTHLPWHCLEHNHIFPGFLLRINTPLWLCLCIHIFPSNCVFMHSSFLALSWYTYFCHGTVCGSHTSAMALSMCTHI